MTNFSIAIFLLRAPVRQRDARMFCAMCDRDVSLGDHIYGLVQISPFYKVLKKKRIVMCQPYPSDQRIINVFVRIIAKTVPLNLKLIINYYTLKYEKVLERI